MRQGEKERKKFQSRIPFILDPGKKIPKRIETKSKNLKTSFRHYFQPKRDEISREREKKILLPNSVHTRLRQENFEKISKKIEKIQKPLSAINFSQNGMRQAEKEKKKFYSRISFILDQGKKIPKKIAKKLKKIKKPLSDIIFCQNRMRQAEKERKKYQSRIPYILDPGKKIPKKIAKKFKKLKNLFPILFLAKTR